MEKLSPKDRRYVGDLIDRLLEREHLKRLPRGRIEWGG